MLSKYLLIERNIILVNFQDSSLGKSSAVFLYILENQPEMGLGESPEVRTIISFNDVLLMFQASKICLMSQWKLFQPEVYY